MKNIQELFHEIQQLHEEEINTIYKMVQALKRKRKSPLALVEEILNFQYVGYDAELDHYVHQMRITDELKNRFHILHGGVTATFIDTAMGATVYHAFGEKTQAVTLDLSIHFSSPGVEGLLYAYTQLVKKGKTILYLDTKVRDEQEKLISAASATFFCRGGDA